MLKVSSFSQKKVANYKFFLEFLIENSNLKTQKNSPTRLIKASASMVGGMFISSNNELLRRKVY